MDGRLFTPLRLTISAAVVIAALGSCGGCGEVATLTVDQGSGPQPELPAPKHTAIPTLNIAPAAPWQAGETPTAATGLAVNAFARDLDHPRWLYVLPNGDVLVAETNAPARPEEGKNLRGKVQKHFMKQAGAVSPSANRITLLRDADGDGVAEFRSVFASGLNSPFGMALVGNTLYVANTDAVVRLPYQPGATSASGAAESFAPLPGGPRNHHWTKNIIASRDGTRLYATVGSNSNVAENGIAAEQGRAAIWEVDVATGNKRLFATGLRNPNGMAWEPHSGTLWTVANERDELGDDLVPDYLTSVKDGAFYGWPYSYYGQNVDARVQPPRPDLVAKAIPPDYARGAHVAALGLVYADDDALPGNL